MKGYTVTPFYLGMDGEQWNPELPGLVIPTGTLTDHGRKASIIVVHGTDGYGVVSYTDWQHTDSLLMAASIVQSMLAELESVKGDAQLEQQ